jgi:EAL domain-containing protein (putative c-di-GMP-specific phosphodiesterase class I)
LRLAAAVGAVRDLRITEERQTPDVVATGTRSDARELRARRCDYARGFYLARPAPAADITTLLQS